MRVFLDTKDLIEVLEHGSAQSHANLRSALVGGGHSLVLTGTRVRELTAPLYYGDRNRVILPGSSPWSRLRPVLARLDSLPLSFIQETRILPLELASAVDCFRSGEEYKDIDPYVARFDQALAPTEEQIATAGFLGMAVSETVWELLKSPESRVFFSGRPRLSVPWSEFIAAEHAIERRPSLTSHFRTVLGADMTRYQIPVEGIDVDALVKWIGASPVRCPGRRLEYEVLHRLLGDRQARPRESDRWDIAGIPACLPYVDVATMDRAMLTRVQQVAERLKMQTYARIFATLSDVILAL